MKKLLLVIPFCLALIGCNQTKINIEKKDIIEIKYNDLVIIEDDYKNIINAVNNITLDNKKITGGFNNTLIIKTNNNIHKFSISNNYYLKYENNEIVLYSNETSNIKKLINNLTSIKKKYIDYQFYTIEYKTNYKNNENNLLIKLDNSNNFFIINTTLPISNLRINDIEYVNNNYIDINLVYNNNNIINDNIILIRRTINKETPDFRISFTNPYNYIVSIIPIYDKTNNKISYIKEFNIKKSP
ncbi:MAG: hypothetical protein GX247_00830 [Mollicutes bacterium]|nr:hypothetical protein [Mollicutes bacterium]